MVNLILGPEGSGKTKQLIASIDAALKNESGNMRVNVDILVTICYNYTNVSERTVPSA